MIRMKDKAGESGGPECGSPLVARADANKVISHLQTKFDVNLGSLDGVEEDIMVFRGYKLLELSFFLRG